MLAAGPLAAQAASPASPTISMKVAGSPADSPVRMSSLAAEVEVMGNIATTTLDMTFVNGTGRVLEGEFEFPLGEGESVTGYALDINGRMRQGVVVENTSGRMAIMGKVIIEATGEGDIMARAGVPYSQIDRTKEELDPPSITFHMDGVDWSKTTAYFKAHQIGRAHV